MNACLKRESRAVSFVLALRLGESLSQVIGFHCLSKHNRDITPFVMINLSRYRLLTFQEYDKSRSKQAISRGHIVFSKFESLKFRRMASFIWVSEIFDGIV